MLNEVSLILYLDNPEKKGIQTKTFKLYMMWHASSTIILSDILLKGLVIYKFIKPAQRTGIIYLVARIIFLVAHIISGFPWLLEILEKPGIYFGSLNPDNSLEFCVNTLNHP